MIHAFSVPGGPGVRIDTCAHTECTISPYYDSLIAKVIVHGRDRQEAIARMRRTLEMTVIEGISTSIPLHLRVLAEPDFQAGRLSTAFMDRYLDRRRERRPAEGRRVILPALTAIVDADVTAAHGWTVPGGGARVPERRRTPPSGARQARAEPRAAGVVRRDRRRRRAVRRGASS